MPRAKPIGPKADLLLWVPWLEGSQWKFRFRSIRIVWLPRLAQTAGGKTIR